MLDQHKLLQGDEWKNKNSFKKLQIKIQTKKINTCVQVNAALLSPYFVNPAFATIAVAMLLGCVSTSFALVEVDISAHSSKQNSCMEPAYTYGCWLGNGSMFSQLQLSYEPLEGAVILEWRWIRMSLIMSLASTSLQTVTRTNKR